MLTSTLLVAWCATVGLSLPAYHRRLVTCGHEPVLSTAVVVIESYNGGRGPTKDAERLETLAVTLRNGHGRPLAATLSTVCAFPDGLTVSPPRGVLSRVLRSPEAGEAAPLRAAIISERTEQDKWARIAHLSTRVATVVRQLGNLDTLDSK